MVAAALTYPAQMVAAALTHPAHKVAAALTHTSTYTPEPPVAHKHIQ